MAGITKTLVQTIKNDQRYNKEVRTALSLQVYAWRDLCMIALAEPEKAAGMAKMLFMQSVPFVNQEYVTQFVADTNDEAVACGTKTGVFA